MFPGDPARLPSGTGKLEGSAMEKKEYDLLFGCFLVLLGTGVILESVAMWRDVGGDFIESPGLMPSVLGVGLVVASLMLVSQSLSGNGREVCCRLRDACMKMFTKYRKETVSFCTVMLALGLFTFVLMPNMPFWLSSFIFMVYTMYLAGARKKIQIVSIAVGVSAALQIIFEVIFRVPLPTNPAMDAFFRGVIATARNLF